MCVIVPHPQFKHGSCRMSYCQHACVVKQVVQFNCSSWPASATQHYEGQLQTCELLLLPHHARCSKSVMVHGCCRVLNCQWCAPQNRSVNLPLLQWLPASIPSCHATCCQRHQYHQCLYRCVFGCCGCHWSIVSSSFAVHFSDSGSDPKKE
jgi:hypothetical protein